MPNTDLILSISRSCSCFICPLIFSEIHVFQNQMNSPATAPPAVLEIATVGSMDDIVFDQLTTSPPSLYQSLRLAAVPTTTPSSSQGGAPLWIAYALSLPERHNFLITRSLEPRRARADRINNK